MKWCQLVIMVWMVSVLFAGLHFDFHGRKAKEPGGFIGAVATLIVTPLLALILWGAGAFSEWF